MALTELLQPVDWATPWNTAKVTKAKMVVEKPLATAATMLSVMPNSSIRRGPNRSPNCAEDELTEHVRRQICRVDQSELIAAQRYARVLIEGDFSQAKRLTGKIEARIDQPSDRKRQPSPDLQSLNHRDHLSVRRADGTKVLLMLSAEFGWRQIQLAAKRSSQQFRAVKTAGGSDPRHGP